MTHSQTPFEDLLTALQPLALEHTEGPTPMAKALLGYVPSQYDSREAARYAAENRALRRQLADLQSLVRRLQEENDLLADRLDPAELLVPSQGGAVEDMQPV